MQIALYSCSILLCGRELNWWIPKNTEKLRNKQGPGSTVMYCIAQKLFSDESVETFVDLFLEFTE